MNKIKSLRMKYSKKSNTFVRGDFIRMADAGRWEELHDKMEEQNYGGFDYSFRHESPVTLTTGDWDRGEWIEHQWQEHPRIKVSIRIDEVQVMSYFPINWSVPSEIATALRELLDRIIEAGNSMGVPVDDAGLQEALAGEE